MTEQAVGPLTGPNNREDWWAVVIGLGLIVVAVALFAAGGSIKWIAVAPQKWSHLSEVGAQLQAHAAQFLALFVLWAGIFGLAATALGHRTAQFLGVFVLVYIVSLLLYFLGLWDQASKYSLEPPLVGLVLGLLISNTVGLPRWAAAGLRVELFIKTGIVLLGTGLPLTLIAWAGPVAIVQAAIVSLATFGVIARPWNFRMCRHSAITFLWFCNDRAPIDRLLAYYLYF